MSVAVCLEDEIDVSRGDMLALPGNLPHAARRFDATVVWMNQKPLEPNRSYLIKHTTQVAQARVREIRYRIDVNTLEHQPARRLELNAIGVVSVEAQRPLLFDPYRQNRFTGSFILIDPITNETMGAGMILQAAASEGAAGPVTDDERRLARGHAPLAICLPPDRTDLAWLLERRLFDQGYTVHVIQEPESLRQAVLTALDAGLIAIVAPAGPADWDVLRQAGPPGQLVRAENAQQAMDAVARAGPRRNGAAGDGRGRPPGPAGRPPHRRRRHLRTGRAEFPAVCCRRGLSQTAAISCSPSVATFRCPQTKSRSCRFFSNYARSAVHVRLSFGQLKSAPNSA